MQFLRKAWLALTMLVGAGSAYADNILVLNSGGWNAPPSNLVSLLTGFGHTVTVQTAQPTSIESTNQSASGYDQVWVFGNFESAGWNAASLQTLLTTYLNNSGAVFVQSEVSCCNAAAAFAQSLMNAVVSPSVRESGATSIVHSVVSTSSDATAVNAALGNRYAGDIMCSGTYGTMAFRDTGSVLPTYELVTLPNGQAPVVFFDEAAMVGQTGRLLVSGDLNYLLQGPGGAAPPITALGENVARMYVDILGDIPNYPTCKPLAVDDVYSTPPGQSTASVLVNDYYQPTAVAALPSNVITTAVGAVPAGLTLNADGTIAVASSVTPGVYSLNYQICRTDAVTVCSAAVATLTVAQASSPSGNNAQPIPSLSELALALLALVLGVLGLGAIRKRQLA